MDRTPEISAELVEISPYLAQISAAIPYGVPAGYFDAFPGLMMERLEAEVALPVAQLPAYQVPVGYFEGLAGNILSKIRERESGLSEVQAELQEIAPLLNTISKTNSYTVPAGYFDAVAFVPVIEKKPAKLIGLTFAKKWTQYAAAAVMAGILVTGAFLYTNDNKVGDSGYSSTDVSSELNTLSETDLANYLDTPESSNTDVLATVKNTINTLSDEELDQYLSENQDVDMIIPASN